MIAGTATPPNAAATGTSAVAGERRSPATNSFFSSRPVRKKKIASRPSDAHSPIVSSRCSGAYPIVMSRTAK